MGIGGAGIVGEGDLKVSLRKLVGGLRAGAVDDGGLILGYLRDETVMRAD
jgi:hypothetical protein